MDESRVNGKTIDTTKNNISMHLKNIFKAGDSTVKKILTVQNEENREVKRNIKRAWNYIT